jgi:purine-nucleoside phosphorylase
VSEAETAAAELAERTGVERHDVAIVLGSGWVPAIDVLGEPAAEFPVTELSGFLPPAVEGHAGRVRSVQVGDRRLLCFLGRTHLYEGRGVGAVVHGVRVAAAAGCRTVILTNACGGLRPGLAVGDPVLISDHLNLTGSTPLVGARFVDLTDLYSARLRRLAREIEPSLAEGVYAQFHGPQYETPAEVRMAGVLGADLVGMSTALEAIAARAEGCEVLGISLVTNLAAGLGDPLDHEEVLAVGKASATRMGELLAELVPRL